MLSRIKPDRSDRLEQCMNSLCPKLQHHKVVNISSWGNNNDANVNVQNSVDIGCD